MDGCTPAGVRVRYCRMCGRDGGRVFLFERRLTTKFQTVRRCGGDDACDSEIITSVREYAYIFITALGWRRRRRPGGRRVRLNLNHDDADSARQRGRWSYARTVGFMLRSDGELVGSSTPAAD